MGIKYSVNLYTLFYEFHILYYNNIFLKGIKTLGIVCSVTFNIKSITYQLNVFNFKYKYHCILYTDKLR